MVMAMVTVTDKVGKGDSSAKQPTVSVSEAAKESDSSFDSFCSLTV